MKQIVRALNEYWVSEQYPITDRVEGWHFRLEEASISHWVAEGTDLWGRKVFREGSCAENVFAQCVQDAQDIVNELSK